MADETYNNPPGQLEVPTDAGEGKRGLVSRWMLEIEQAGAREKSWRKSAAQTVERFRDEKPDGEINKRTGSTARFNILWANTSILRPKLYNSKPRPDVRRRFKKKDRVGRKIATMIEQGLAYCADEHDIDQTYKLSVLDYLLVGRGFVRVKYSAEFDDAPIEAGSPMLGHNNPPEKVKVYETTYPQHWAWRNVRVGPADKWDDLPWLAYKHILSRAECIDSFGEEIGNKVPLDHTVYSTNSTGETEMESTHGDIFKMGVVWEVWDKATRSVIWLAEGLDEEPLSVDPDPLELEGFFDCPRPLYSVETSDTLVPIEEYRLYRDQAEELDSITRRIQVIVRGLKVRGIYASTITELERLATQDDNTMVPSEGALAAMQTGGLERAIWMWPIKEAAEVLVYLYNQRDQIKQVIYEITGLSDILRGSTDPNETLGAQKLKAQSGGLRLSDRQAEVQRFVRDVYRIQAEIMAEQFSTESWELMTGEKPTAEMMVIMKDDKSRGFRIDVETDSTVALDQQKDEENAGKIIEAVAKFSAAMVPAVQAGVIPKDLVMKLLMPMVRRAKLGREIEDAIDQLIGDEDDGQNQQGEQGMIKMTAEQFEQEKQALQQQAMEEATQQAEQGVANEKAGIEAAKKQMQVDQKTAQLELIAREKMVELHEKQLGINSTANDQAIERRAMDVGLREARVDLRENVSANREGELGEAEEQVDASTQVLEAVTQAIAQLSAAVAQSVAVQGDQNATLLAALSAPKELVKDASGRPIGVRTRLDG